MSEILVYGEYDQLTPDHESLWAYTRAFEGERLLVVLNFSDTPTVLDFSAGDHDMARSLDLLLANYDIENTGATVSDLLGSRFRPWEARIYHIAPSSRR